MQITASATHRVNADVISPKKPQVAAAAATRKTVPQMTKHPKAVVIKTESEKSCITSELAVICVEGR